MSLFASGETTLVEEGYELLEDFVVSLMLLTISPFFSNFVVF